MRISDWSSDVCSSDLAAPFVRVADFLLDELGGLELVGEPRRIGELGIDLGEIHAAEIKPGELVESEAKTLLGLGLAPGLGKLRAALFLPVAGQLGFKAAVNLLLGQADAEEARRSEARRVGKECVSTCRSRRPP